MQEHINTIKIGISICPNDIFICAGVLLQEVKSNLLLDISLLEISELNLYAQKEFFDVVKISAALFPQISENYNLLPIGSSFSKDEGPKIVRRLGEDKKVNFKEAVIASCGGISAETIMSILFSAKNYKRYSLGEVPLAVAKGECDYGLIINETRDNLQAYGLEEVADLSRLWWEKTKFLAPLGCYVIHKRASAFTKEICKLLNLSILWSKDNPKEVENLSLKWGKEKSESLLWKHIDNFSKNSNLIMNDFEKKSFFKFCELAKGI